MLAPVNAGETRDSTVSSKNFEPNSSVPSTRQGGTDATFALEWIETNLDITFQDPVRLSIKAEFNVHEIFLPDYVNEGHMTASEIRWNYQNEVIDTPVNPKIKLSLENKVDELFKRILNKTFPDSMRIFDNPKLDLSSIYNITYTDPYNPPVVVDHYCTYLELTESAFFSEYELMKYNIQNLPDLIEGSLKAGATITQDLKLFANAGHKNSYLFHVKNLGTSEGASHDQLSIEQENNEISSLNKDKVKLTIDNTIGDSYFIKPIKNFTLKVVEPNQQKKENIDIEFNIEMVDIDEILIKDSKISVHALNLRETVKKLPTNFSDLAILSADGIRLFYYNGIINLTELEQDLDFELRKIELEFSKMLNTSSGVSLFLDWNISSVLDLLPLYHLDEMGSYDRMGTVPPIVGTLFSNDIINYNYFGNYSDDLLIGLLNAGAVADLDLSIDTNYDYTFNLTLHNDLLLLNKIHTGIDIIGRQWYRLNSNDLKHLKIGSKKSVNYESSKANIEVKIDIHEIDIVSFTEYVASVKIESTGILHHLKMDPNTRFSMALPKKVTLDYFNSDALRLIYSEDLLDFEDVEEDIYSAIRENISKMVKEDFSLSVDFDEDRLTFDGDIDNMDDKIPVKFNIQASGKMRIKENKMVRMGGFITKQIEIPMTGMKNWNVTYILILPQYIDIYGSPWVNNNGFNYSGPIVEQNSDGRYELRLQVIGATEEENEIEVVVNVEIDITIWFFLNKIIIPLLLFIILLILIIVIKVRRRQKSKKLEKLLEDEEMSIDDDYYSVEPDYYSHDHHGDERAYKRGWDQSSIGSSIPKKRGGGKTRRIDYDSGVGDDYSQQLRELVPRIAPERTREKRRSKSPKKINAKQMRKNKNIGSRTTNRSSGMKSSRSRRSSRD